VASDRTTAARQKVAALKRHSRLAGTSRSANRVSQRELDAARRSTLQRLKLVASELEEDGRDWTPVNQPMELLTALVARVQRSLRPDEAWLVMTAFSTVFPSDELVSAFLRMAELSTVDETVLWLLESTLPLIRSHGEIASELNLVVNGVVVDADFAAKNEHNSGIQRVVRRVVPIWAQRHSLELVAWVDDKLAWRGLTDVETERVLRWDGTHRPTPSRPTQPRITIPWKSTVLLVEVPNKIEQCLPLAAMARLSGNTVNGIGYDVIPITSAETVPIDMSDHFAKYLTITKYMAKIAAISVTAAREFAGFESMLSSQGLSGASIVACVLPSDQARQLVPQRVTGIPLVVCVGSKEPRKNHVAVLAAAERLWLEGLEFELFFVGVSGWDARYFRAWESRLARAGYPLRAPARVSDQDLWQAYADARFTIFPSLHEGYGLPVAESLSYGTPVIATNYGSTAEIAASGGCIEIDPRDDDAIVGAMRTLLTDDALRGRLSVEALARPVRTWDDYAAEVWNELVGSA
jgi:glycosyltransferase involved in cell wall biosynthesis